MLLTLGLVGPCGVGGAAAGSSTGIMALRFLLGFLLAGVDLGVYLMRKWHPARDLCLGSHGTFLFFPAIFAAPRSQISAVQNPLFKEPSQGSRFFPHAMTSKDLT